MKHNHSHSCQCSHSTVRFCSHCNTVYCLGCNQEWTAKSTWTYGYPWYTTTGGYLKQDQNQVGGTGGGGSYTVDNTSISNQLQTSSCDHKHGK